jgi:Na+-transporting NADH:ubiquinone oxidoreductase subunit F
LIYLSTLGVSFSLALFFGIVLLAADALLSTYGDCKIRINNDKELVLPGGDTLLSSLFAKKYFIPSACGGKGTCGYCKVKLPGSDLPLLATEKMVLSPQEIDQGWRLSCQIKVKTDMNVWMPEEYFLIKEYSSMVESTKTIAKNIKEINFKLISPDKIIFKPGQYIQVHIPAKGSTIYRSYSIASHPQNKQIITLNVKLEEKGIGSTWLHNLKKGDIVNISGPYGDFIVKNSGKNVVLIAGGVGLAPISSIIEEFTSKNPAIKAVLYFKVKYEDELYYLEKLEDWKKIWPSFSYHLIVSDIPETEKFKKGLRGRITKVLDNYIHNHLNDDFYLCGAPVMINGLMEYFKEKNIPENSILYDKFE